MSNPIQNADYFIAKFEAIPDNRWCVNTYEGGGIIRRKHCAVGHCGVRDFFTTTDEARCLYQVFGDLMVTAVNDGRHPGYPQPTPKQRILAALRDIKAMEGK